MNPPKKRGRLKKALMATGIVMVILLGCAIWLVYHDGPVPDDSGLRQEFKPIAKEDNAAYLLSRLTGMPKTKVGDFPELKNKLPPLKNDKHLVWSFLDILREEYRDSEIFPFVMEKNKEAIALFWEASKKPAIQFSATPWETSPNYDKELQLPTLDMIRVACVIDFSCERMRRDGQMTQSLDESCRLLDFSCRLASAEGACLVYFTHSLAINTIARGSIVRCVELADNGALCVETARKLGALEVPDTAMIAVVKSEYAIRDEILREADLQKRMFDVSRYSFKINQTRALLINMYREIIAAIINDNMMEYKKRVTEADPSNGENTLQKFKPNAIGEYGCAIMAPGFPSAYIRMLETRAKTRQAACAFAIRAYWLEHGKIPPALDTLVPKYIKSVPEDPFTNKPMPYDPAKALLYCAGPERINDDGTYAFEDWDYQFNSRRFDNRPFMLLDWAASAPPKTPPQAARE